MELLLSVILLFYAATVFFYSLIPKKGKELVLLKRLKKSTEVLKKKGLLTGFIDNFVGYIEIRTKRWNVKFINAYKDNLEEMLNRAALQDKLTHHRFFAIQIASGIGGMVFYLLVLVFLLEAIEMNVIYLFLFLLVGFYMPILWMQDIRKKREKKILKALPDTLDLLTLCVEAGLDFSAGINKIVTKGKEGPLKDEFARLENEISIGASRIEALRNMMKRNDIDDLGSFLISLIQAIKMGTSLAPILRAQAEQIRMKRSLRAEKIAAEAPVKMLGPLLICIFPTVFIIIFTPIIMKYLIK
ncbi:MAG: type II secretion system F family protein [Spirochaetes bacterium]|nr:type II secretion system F family protein [Spirochaetota bacterium]